MLKMLYAFACLDLNAITTAIRNHYCEKQEVWWLQEILNFQSLGLMAQLCTNNASSAAVWTFVVGHSYSETKASIPTGLGLWPCLPNLTPNCSINVSERLKFERSSTQLMRVNIHILANDPVRWASSQYYWADRSVLRLRRRQIE